MASEGSFRLYDKIDGKEFVSRVRYNVGENGLHLIMVLEGLSLNERPMLLYTNAQGSRLIHYIAYRLQSMGLIELPEECRASLTVLDEYEDVDIHNPVISYENQLPRN
jgi:hypothetical protein